MPIRLHATLFEENAPRRGAASPHLEEEMALVAALARPQEPCLLTVGGCCIHRAAHCENPGTAALERMAHGDHLVVAVCAQLGAVVGFVRQDLLWVRPDYRGRNLGPQMAVQLLIEMGCETWDGEQWRAWLQTPVFTPGGYHNRRKLFGILVHRGVIEDARATL